MRRSAAEKEFCNMALISVPKPKNAYNPDRPMGSLLKAQVDHLREAESKLPLRYRHEIETYIKAIKTEAEAANYIRKVTEAIHDAHRHAERARHAPAGEPAQKLKPVIENAAVADERRERTARAKKKTGKAKGQAVRL
jgi:hypothetical protein